MRIPGTVRPNPWLFDERTRDHGLAPVIRIKGVPMGTDKWEHFFQQGGWNWDLAYGPAKDELKRLYPRTTFPDFTQLAVRTAFAEWLEGTNKTRANAVDPLVANYDAEFAMIAKLFGIKGVKGIYGSYSTGVISYADMCANEQGFQFYTGLYKAFLQNSNSPTARFTFDVDNYDIYNMNEQNNPNRFVNGVIVNDGLDNTIPPMKRPAWVPPAFPGPVKPPTW